MDYDKLSQSTSQVYKSSNWADRKRELKTTRNQRTTKSIKNIKVIDTPSDPNFNCNSHLTKIAPSMRLLPHKKLTNTAISLATRYSHHNQDQIQGQCKRSLLLRQGSECLHQDDEQTCMRTVPHPARRDADR